MNELLSGHSAFGDGVTVTIVETSIVGVNVGMVGRGVIVEVAVSVGKALRVEIGEDISVESITVTGATGAAGVVQEVRRKIIAIETSNSLLFTPFLLPTSLYHPDSTFFRDRQLFCV